MLPKMRLKAAALLIVGLGSLMLTDPEPAIAVPMRACPERVHVESCNDIPGWVYAECAACNRPVTCYWYYDVNEQQYYWAAGCEFDS